MPRYSDDFRAKAVAALKVAGFPDKHGALIDISREYEVPVYTLRRWFTDQQNPPPEALVESQVRDMRSLLLEEAYTVLNMLPNKRNEASYRQLTLSLSLYFEKIQFLSDMPSQMIEVMPTLREIFQMVKRLKWSPDKFFNDLLDEMNDEYGRRLDAEVGATPSPMMANDLNPDSLSNRHQNDLN